jgi:hypothetical protein
MYRKAPGVPGRHWLERLLSSRARRAAKRDFLFSHLPKGGVAIEVGVFDGDFSERILHFNEPRIDGPTQHFDSTAEAAASLEDQYQNIQRRFAAEIRSGRIVVHRMLSHDAAPLFPDEHFDWAYVDASHFYDDVKRDLYAFYPKIRHGGYMLGDDYDRRGIWDHGVTRAVDEFRRVEAVDTLELRNHQFLIRKR